MGKKDTRSWAGMDRDGKHRVFSVEQEKALYDLAMDTSVNDTDEILARAERILASTPRRVKMRSESLVCSRLLLPLVVLLSSCQARIKHLPRKKEVWV